MINKLHTLLSPILNACRGFKENYDDIKAVFIEPNLPERKNKHEPKKPFIQR